MKNPFTYYCPVFALLCIMAAAGHAATQYPDKPVRVIIPGPAGGPTDVAARVVGEGLSEILGPLVMDNRSGAAGMIGADIVARATSDGYTLLFTHAGPLGLAPMLMASPPYNPQRDFTPISQVVSMPMLLIANPNLPAKSVQELIALAKAQPGKLRYGSGGLGTGIYMAAEMFKSAAHVNILHVPYKGAAPAMTGLMSGEVNVMFNGLANVLSLVKSGRARALAVGGTQRTRLLPDLPTIGESGLPFDYSGWYGLVGPRDLPEPIIAKISDDITKTLNSASVKSRLDNLGMDAIGSSPVQFTAYLRNWNKKMADVITTTGMKAQ